MTARISPTRLGIGFPGWRALVSPSVASAVVIGVAALVLRLGQLGNPLAGLDEQLYLLMGDRLLHGELPYLDIWDRKPVGLFLLFAAIRALPGDGVVAAQATAIAFAGATAWFMALLCRRWVGWTPATFAALFYIAGLNQLWVDTTQTPVFYDLFIILSALLSLRAADAGDEGRRLRLGLAAMLLGGVAIQIKTSALFQGGFFGLWIVAASWSTQRSWRASARIAAALALAGAVPTLLAMIGYAAIGGFDAWWQANVLSVVAKGRPADPAAWDTLVETAVLAAPVCLLAVYGLLVRRGQGGVEPQSILFVVGWAVLSVVDFVAIGGFYPHYAVPFLLACCPLAAFVFARPGTGPIMGVLALAWPTYVALAQKPMIAGSEITYAERVVAALPADVRDRCLFIYEGPVAYYHLTQACRVTRFAFTAHLGSHREAAALPVDPAAELARVFARRPGTVLTVSESTWRDHNPATDAIVAEALARDYRVVARLPHRHYAPDERLLIWRRRD